MNETSPSGPARQQRARAALMMPSRGVINNSELTSRNERVDIADIQKRLENEMALLPERAHPGSAGVSPHFHHLAIEQLAAQTPALPGPE